MTNSADIRDAFADGSQQILARLDATIGARAGAAPDSAALLSAFRDFHTLKASAAFLSLPDTVAQCHASESAIEKILADGRVPEPAELGRLRNVLAGLYTAFGAGPRGRVHPPASLRPCNSKPRSSRSYFLRLPALVREMGEVLGKNIALEIGGDIPPLDPQTAATVHAIVLHILRNAVDHGIEDRAERAAAGKAECGRLELTCAHSSGVFTLRLRDDGRGIDRARLRREAVRQGLDVDCEPARVDVADCTSLVCLAGITSCEAASTLSGRGLGLNLVRAELDALEGDLQVISSPGVGTDVLITLPLESTPQPHWRAAERPEARL